MTNEHADTSRDKREGELEGREYHFCKKEALKSDIDKGAYVEWGEYNGNLYGTSVQSVRDIVGTGRVCVLDCRCVVPHSTPYSSAVRKPRATCTRRSSCPTWSSSRRPRWRS